MRLCVHDIETGKFRKMIEPIFIESCIQNEYILYVYDLCGSFTLRFPTHEQLKNCLISLRDNGYASARCEHICYGSIDVDKEFERKRIEIEETEFEREI